MNSMKNKIAVICIIIILSELFLTGCLGQEKDIHTTYKETTLPVETFDSSIPRVYYFGKDLSNNTDGNYKEIYNELTKLTITTMNINLQFNFVSGIHYDIELQKAINSADQIDICDSVYVMEDMSHEIINKYNLADITDILSKIYPTAIEIINESKEVLPKISLDNKIYAVPGRLSSGLSNLYAIVTDKNVFKKSKMIGINNFLDYINYYNVCVEGGIIGKNDLFMCDLDLFIRLYLECFGYYYLDYGLVYSPDEKAVVPMESLPKFIEAYTTYSDMLQKGFFTYATDVYVNPHEIISLPETASYVAQPVLYRTLISENKLAFETFQEKHDVFLLNENTSYYISYITYPNFYIINNGNGESALKVINFIMTNQTAYDLLRYGILNKNYYLKNNKVCLYDSDKCVINWRRSYTFSPVLERQFISEIQTGYDIRITVNKNTPFSYDLYRQAISNLYSNDTKLNINEFSKARSVSNILMHHPRFYTEIKEGMTVEEYMRLISSFELDDFLNYFNNILK